MFFDGYKSRLRTIRIALVAIGLRENHQVDLKLHGMRTIKVL